MQSLNSILWNDDALKNANNSYDSSSDNITMHTACMQMCCSMGDHCQSGTHTPIPCFAGAIGCK